MEGLKPGRIVYFVLDEMHARSINGRYADAHSPAGVDATVKKSGVQIHVGNRVHAGDICPAMVTAVHTDTGLCNLKVMLDGNDIYWATSVDYHTDKRHGSWHWMFDGQAERYRPDRVERGQDAVCAPSEKTE